MQPPGHRADSGDALQRLVDEVAGRLLHVDLRLDLRLDLRTTSPSGSTIALPTPRLEERAAVGERGVGPGELQRGDHGVALADREVDRVAGAVGEALDAELAREAVEEVVARLLADLAVVVLHRLVVLALPLPVGDPAAGLAREVDAGLLAEAELLGLLDQRVLGVDVVDVGAVLLPEVVADPVEEGVAGDLERLLEADVAVGAGLVVLEVAVADLEATRSRSARCLAVAVAERAGGHERLPGGAGGELSLGGAREQRGAGLVGVEALQLAAADAAHPHASGRTSAGWPWRRCGRCRPPSRRRRRSRRRTGDR